jgi:hypothetical protein
VTPFFFLCVCLRGSTSITSPILQWYTGGAQTDRWDLPQSDWAPGFASQRAIGPVRSPILQYNRRHLGDSVRGPPLTDLPANLRYAVEFFTKPAISYADYKQQCVSLRLFAFAGITGGCVLSLMLDPPQSSYWMRASPKFWLTHLKGTFYSTTPPGILSDKVEHAANVPDIVNQLVTTRRILGAGSDSEEERHCTAILTLRDIQSSCALHDAEEVYGSFSTEMLIQQTHPSHHRTRRSIQLLGPGGPHWNSRHCCRYGPGGPCPRRGGRHDHHASGTRRSMPPAGRSTVTSKEHAGTRRK